MKTQLLTLAALLLLSLSNCSPEDNDSALRLPPITTTGENTFGCYIDGKLFVPRDGRGTFGGEDDAVIIWSNPEGHHEYTELDIHDFKSQNNADITIHIKGLDSLGAIRYTIGKSNGFSGVDGVDNTFIHCRFFDDKSNSYQYYRSFENSGMINILRYDFIPFEKKIISGTFECLLVNTSNSNDQIIISDGRFDFDGFTLANKKFP